MAIKLKSAANRTNFVLGLELIGVGLVVIGVSLFSMAAGLVVAGTAFIGIGYLLE